MTTHLISMCAAGALLIFSATAANADILHFEAILKGAGETPVVVSPAKGDVIATIDTDRGVLDYTVTYSGLSGPVTGAGFGPVKGDPTDPIVNAPTTSAARSLHATVSLTPAQINDLAAGRWFFDVRTAAHPAGEIRGVVRRTSLY